MISCEQAAAVLAEADCLYTSDEVETALQTMADDITVRLADADMLFLSVMNGGLVPAAGLLSRLQFPLQLDYLHATRYRGGTSGQSLDWLHKPATALSARTVLVVDDILDEGITLAAILEYCRQQGVAEVYSAVLVQKKHDRCLHNMQADFTGLMVEDRYVFGCGMDYYGYHRNLTGIYAVKE